MTQRIAAKITGVAGYVPPRVVTNADIEKMVDTTDEWIRSRTGIRERHFADPGVASSHLGTEAAKKLLAAKGVRAGRNRPDRGGHGHAGHAVSRDGLPDPGPPGRNEGLGLRSFRGVLGFRLRADGGRAVCGRGIAQESAGDRRGRNDIHSRFQGPRHLRAFRGRRGRCAARTRRFGSGRNHRFSSTMSTAQAAATFTCPLAARSIRLRTKRSRSGCTTFTRKASRCSSTP